MDGSDWSNGLRYHNIDTRPDTEFKPFIPKNRSSHPSKVLTVELRRERVARPGRRCSNCVRVHRYAHWKQAVTMTRSGNKLSPPYQSDKI